MILSSKDFKGVPGNLVDSWPKLPGTPLRQVIGIKNLNKMSTYHLACGIVKLRGLNESFSQTRYLSTNLP